MGKKNILLLGVAIIAIGLFVIPSTMSMFVGQHQWYSVRTADSQYDLCQRCHPAEVGEWKANLARGGAHAAYGTANTGCFCHQVNNTKLATFGFNATTTGFTFEVFNESGDINSTAASWEGEWRSNDTQHAAITIDCADCHYNATAQLSKNDSAHKKLYDESVIAGNANTACMACHTMVGLNITMDRNYGGLVINASHTIATNGSYVWAVNVSVNNTARQNSTYWFAPNNTTSVLVE